jgi:hypothetical protein
MERMTEPGAVKNVFHFPARRSRGLERVLDERLYLVAQSIEHILLFDCFNQCFSSHVLPPMIVRARMLQTTFALYLTKL